MQVAGILNAVELVLVLFLSDAFTGCCGRSADPEPALPVENADGKRVSKAKQVTHSPPLLLLLPPATTATFSYYYYCYSPERLWFRWMIQDAPGLPVCVATILESE